MCGTAIALPCAAVDVQTAAFLSVYTLVPCHNGLHQSSSSTIVNLHSTYSSLHRRYDRDVRYLHISIVSDHNSRTSSSSSSSAAAPTVSQFCHTQDRVNFPWQMADATHTAEAIALIIIAASTSITPGFNRLTTLTLRRQDLANYYYGYHSGSTARFHKQTYWSHSLHIRFFTASRKANESSSSISMTTLLAPP